MRGNWRGTSPVTGVAKPDASRRLNEPQLWRRQTKRETPALYTLFDEEKKSKGEASMLFILGIPAKMNASSGAKPNGIPG